MFLFTSKMYFSRCMRSDMHFCSRIITLRQQHPFLSHSKLLKQSFNLVADLVGAGSVKKSVNQSLTIYCFMLFDVAWNNLDFLGFKLQAVPSYNGREWGALSLLVRSRRKITWQKNHLKKREQFSCNWLQCLSSGARPSVTFKAFQK